MASGHCQQFEPSLKNILNQTTLKWVFVGGKGGVGKTTCSCGLAVQLSRVRESVLIISTDPVGNISHVLGQRFAKLPTLVNGFKNLYAMEFDPTVGFTDLPDEFFDNSSDPLRMTKNMMPELAGVLPGIDEAMSYAEVLKLVKKMNFSVVIFDTAPTGHTLRLLSFSEVVIKGLSKFLRLNTQLYPFFRELSTVLGSQNITPEVICSKIGELLLFFLHANEQFRNSEHTTFVCVSIAEFLSLKETDQLIHQLWLRGIDTHNIVVNQLIFPKFIDCNLCKSRHEFQFRYLNQIANLYKNFHITKLPLLDHEVRGINAVIDFSENLITPR